MREIVLIAPYQNMYRLSQELIQKHAYSNVEVVFGDLREGVKVANQALENGAKVLISRGGTFTLIQDAVAAPVVEIHTNIYDVIANIRHVIKQNRPIAIVGHSNIVYGYDLIKDLMQSVKQVNIERGEKVETKIKQCVREGITTFVGDAVVNSFCQEHGYTCYMLESGENAICAAIEEAIRILLASDREIERSKRYLTLIDYVHDGVIATDNENRILLFNAVAQEILGIQREDALGRNISQLSESEPVLAEIAQGALLFEQVRRMGRSQIMISNIPIEVNLENKGSVAVFQDVAKLQNLEKKARLQLAEKGFVAKHTFQSIIHRSDAMAQCISVAQKFSRYDSSVLIEGNSGVGKELFAQSIHNASRRCTGPFVAINCAALPGSLIESELFGYVEGAFTGSKKGGKAGVFELAHKGTLFLDEISELAIDLQGRLLRVIQEHEVMRLGDNRVIPLDVRIVCATNRDLKEMVRDNRFRRDLLYRINTLSFYIPPLSARTEDIEVLAEHFLVRYCKRYGKEIAGFTGAAMQTLKAHDYEGNIRELQGMVERAVIVCEDTLIKSSDLGDGRGEASAHAGAEASPALPDPLAEGAPSLQELESRYIRQVYAQNGNSTTKACQILKIDRSTLWRKLKPL